VGFIWREIFDGEKREENRLHLAPSDPARLFSRRSLKKKVVFEEKRKYLNDLIDSKKSG
jgi:hypothetical protein